jgi:hypothetical protein
VRALLSIVGGRGVDEKLVDRDCIYWNHKHKTPETVKVAEALFHHIRRMCAEQTRLGSAETLEIKKWALRRAVVRETGEFVVPPEILPSRILIEGPSQAPHLNVQV